MATAPLTGNSNAREILPSNPTKEVKLFNPKAKEAENTPVSPIEGKQVTASVNTEGQTVGTTISTSA
ncbi:MAG: hypothetical protein Q8Q55_00700 [Undibacterium sp.]|nr:hypothetical protein [Undibacterium sp.]